MQVRRLSKRQVTMRLVAVFGGLIAATFCLEAACYPWAHPLPFHSSLTGDWIGEMTVPVLGRTGVFVTLIADIDDGGDDLDGVARLCDGRGPHPFRLSGRTKNWSGTRFRFTTFPPENVVEAEGVQLGRADGEWDRGQTLRLTAKLVKYSIHNGASFSTTARPPEQIAIEDTPVVFTLTRGTEAAFAAGCDRLRAAGESKSVGGGS
jgi:hypothetical protein